MMTYNDIQASPKAEEPQAETRTLGVNMEDLVKITFLEQSARYLGVYVSPFNTESVHEEYLIN